MPESKRGGQLYKAGVKLQRLQRPKPHLVGADGDGESDDARGVGLHAQGHAGEQGLAENAQNITGWNGLIQETRVGLGLKWVEG